jgi:hypothetical protein
VNNKLSPKGHFLSQSEKSGGGHGVVSDRASGMAKFHALMFSLLFPGLLAAFILTQFTEEARIPGFEPWSWLLCLYFAVQFVEGHETKAKYGLPRAVINVLEMAGMVLIFAALGYFPDLKIGGIMGSPSAICALMAVVFALPVVHRLLFASETLSKAKPGYLFAWSVTAMSLIAAVLSGFFAANTWAWVVVLAMLITYMTVFQFCNDWLFSSVDVLSHPRIAAFRRP